MLYFHIWIGYAINQGLPEDTIVAITGLDLATIKKITEQK
jgi:hypothetical protein